MATPDTTRRRKSDRLVFAVLAALVVLNSSVIDFSVISFGLIAHSIFYQILGSVILLLILARATRNDLLSVQMELSKGVFLIAVYLTFLGFRDLVMQEFSYAATPIPVLFLTAICYGAYVVIARIGIDDLPGFTFKLQIVLLVVALVAILQYLLPQAFPQTGRIEEYMVTEKTGFTRFSHMGYHLAMLSFFLLPIQLYYGRHYSFSQIAFLIINAIPQATSIFIANYRASILATAFYLGMALLFSFLAQGGKRSRVIFIVVLACIALTVLISVDFGDLTEVGWLARLFETEDAIEDNNMQWRLVELAYAISEMSSPIDYVLGFGYSHSFEFFGYNVFYLHNGYVTILYNFGIIGVSLFAMFVVKTFKLIRAARFADPFLSRCGLAWGMSILIQNFSSSVVNREQSGTLAMLIFVIVLSSAQTSEHWRTQMPSAEGHGSG